MNFILILFIILLNFSSEARSKVPDTNYDTACSIGCS